MAHEEVDSAGVEPPGVVRQEVSQLYNLVPERSLCQRIFADFLHQLGYSSSLNILPPGPGKITDTCLDDQENTNPLVVVVVDCTILSQQSMTVTETLLVRVWQIFGHGYDFPTWSELGTKSKVKVPNFEGKNI